MEPAAAIIFDTAKKLNVPVLVHTGSGIPFSVPSLVIPRAREYPKVKIIRSQSGFPIPASDAWVAARECPNVYFETSWSSPNDVLQIGA